MVAAGKIDEQDVLWSAVRACSGDRRGWFPRAFFQPLSRSRPGRPKPLCARAGRHDFFHTLFPPSCHSVRVGSRENKSVALGINKTHSDRNRHSSRTRSHFARTRLGFTCDYSPHDFGLLAPPASDQGYSDQVPDKYELQILCGLQEPDQ